MFRSSRSFVFCTALLALLPAVAAVAAQPTEAEVRDRMASWLESEGFRQISAELDLIPSLEIDPSRLTWTPPDRLRCLVGVRSGASLAPADRSRAEEQLKNVFINGFVEQEMKQFYDTTDPAQANAFAAVKSNARVELETADSDRDPTTTLVAGPPLAHYMTSRVGCLFKRYITEVVLEPTWIEIPRQNDAAPGRSATAQTRTTGSRLVPGAPQPMEPMQLAPRTAPLVAMSARPPVHFVSHQAILETISGADAKPEAKPLDRALASELFGMAFHAFWDKDYAAAAKHLELAASVNAGDPRIWYYRGFIAMAQSDADAARTYLAEAIRLHARLNSPQMHDVSRCLERVQGSFRNELQTALTMARLNPSAAQEQTTDLIAAKP